MNFCQNSIEENIVVLSITQKILSFNINIHKDKVPLLNYVKHKLLAQILDMAKKCDRVLEQSLNNRDRKAN